MLGWAWPAGVTRRAYDSGMTYPRRLLNENEEIALDLKPHWWFFARQILIGIPLFVLLILLLQVSGTAAEVGRWVWGVLALVWAVWLLVKYLDWYFTHFVVTSERVIFRTGVLSKHGVEIPLERINNINFDQPIWERMIGAGDLAIESAGKDGQSAFEDVRHPDAVQQEIYRQMEAYGRRRASFMASQMAPPAPAPAEAAPTAPSIPDQLQQLADLRDRGVISAAEFEQKKAELLGRM